jgi:hypothetical protein
MTLSKYWAVAATLAPILVVSCGSPTAPSSATGARDNTLFSAGGARAGNVLVGAGDIAVCGSAATDATAALLDTIPGTVFTAGDNVYHSGTMDEFMRCYDPTWGRHKARTRPTPGNHDYSHGASAYFSYFGPNAGPPGLGYYSYRVGSWQVLSLNSNIPAGEGSPQLAWVRQELARNPASCTAAIWHHPVFTSGQNGPQPMMREVWRTLALADVDVAIVAHDHVYERFAPLDAEGRPASRGIRQFTVGTGGAAAYPFTSLALGSESRASAHGVLKLTLDEGSYDWEFIPIPGVLFRDSGSGECH